MQGRCNAVRKKIRESRLSAMVPVKEKGIINLEKRSSVCSRQLTVIYGFVKKADSGFMSLLDAELIKNRGMTRRQVMRLGVMGLAGWMLSAVRIASAALKDDLALVSIIPHMAEREGPRLVFRDFVPDPDLEVEQHIRLQLGQRKDMLDLVRKKIGFENQVRLSVEDIQVRLMFVPQLREAHADAYQRYCRDITAYFFELNEMDNCIAAITSPNESYPPLAQNGISAFVVHRLAKDFRAVCRFTAESGLSVKYNASGAIFSNHLGAVDLEIQSIGPGQYGLSRREFTMWQTNTDNLYALMSIPVEETLHYQLGKATDREIAASMNNQPPENLYAAQRLAEAWMAVEESVVGGLVNRVLDRYCTQHHMVSPFSVHGEALPAVPSLHQYRYRDRGIRLVNNLGFQEAFALYMQSPSSFKDQLLCEQDA
ncbi:MAG: hypothetical protein V2I40_00405 [Desulfobacteraceae bacterium]|jgi:hypothetical protein|nr:hypothetical protein [Desulfobacteraceae bacterium]